MKAIFYIASIVVLSACSAEDRVTSLCIDATKSFLKAPSTMQVIEKEVNFDLVNVSPEEEANWRVLLRHTDAQVENLADRTDDTAVDIILENIRLRERVSAIDRAKSGGESAKSWRVKIEYDAQNAMGVPLRATAFCDTTAWSGKIEEMFTFNLLSNAGSKECRAIKNDVYCH